MDYDNNYIEVAYNPEELNEIFIKEFISFRKENNLTQDLFSKYSGVSSPSVLSLLKILGPIGYTIKIEKVKNK